MTRQRARLLGMAAGCVTLVLCCLILSISGCVTEGYQQETEAAKAKAQALTDRARYEADQERMVTLRVLAESEREVNPCALLGYPCQCDPCEGQAESETPEVTQDD